MNRLLRLCFLPCIGLGVLAFLYSADPDTGFAEKERLAPDNPGEAAEWFYGQRAFPLGYIPSRWREEALDHISRNNMILAHLRGNQALTWTQLGPGNIGGRIRTIVVHPTNSNIIYLGAVAGGVWKTVNGGASWAATDDFMGNLAVCALVMDPTNPNVLYAGTGEGFGNYDFVQGAGIFKTTNGGTSWSRLASTNSVDFFFVNKLEIDRTTNAIWAGTQRGLYKSTDQGSTFVPLLTSSPPGSDVLCVDVEIAYTTPSTILSSFGVRGGNASVWRSSDAGSNFSQVLGQSTSYGRIEIGVSPSAPLLVLVSIMDLSTQGIGVMASSTSGGASGTFNQITIPGPTYGNAHPTYAASQAWYNNIVSVDPTNPSILYAAGLDFWKSTNSGATWTQKTNWFSEAGAPPQVHADQHAIAFDPSNPNILYLGTDGGIYKSTNKGETWTSLNNNLVITQFYYGAVDPVASRYYGGTQDNGTLKSTGSSSWFEIFGGDGGATEVDQSNPNIIYAEYVFLNFVKSTNQGLSFTKSMNGIPSNPGPFGGTTDRVQFIAPFSMDPNNSSTLVAGTYRVFRTTDRAENWSAISGDLTGDGAGSQGATISTVVLAQGNSNVIYVGCTNGRVQVTTNGGTSWNLRNTGLPTAVCTRIATAPATPATAYATFSGFLAGSKVFKTTNFGVSWTNISNNLPNIPVSCVLVNPDEANNIFVGTDLGVFSTTNGGQAWVQDNAGLANVVVMDLDHRASDGKIFAATHGRGMYSSILGGSAQTTVYAGDANNDASCDVRDILPIGRFYGSTGPVRTGGSTTWGAQIATVWSTLGSTYADCNGDGTVDDTDVDAIISNYGLTHSSPPGTPVDRLAACTALLAEIDRQTVLSQPMKEIRNAIISYMKRNLGITFNYALAQNYPNPFNPSTTISFTVPEQTGQAELKIYDMVGREVWSRMLSEVSPGSHRVVWEGVSNGGEKVASGIYVYRFTAGSFSASKRMLLVK